jgi:IPT/TIG domain-containing protein
VVHVSGKNFGNDPARIVVAIGHTEVAARSVSGDSIDVEVPKELEPGTYPLVITDRKTNKSSAPVQINVQETVRIPAHTKVMVRMAQSIGSETSTAGDTVHLVLNEPLVFEGRIAIPKGSEVIGQVTRVNGSGKVKGRAAIGFTLKEIKRGTDSLPLDVDEFYRTAPSTVRRDVKTIGITTGVGTLIGALAGGGKGAAIGAAVGGGTGTGAVLLTKGKNVVIPEGGVYEFVLQQPIEFEVAQPLPRLTAAG